MSAGLVTTLILIYGGFSALGIAAGVSILRKAGYSPWWVITGFIPLLNVVMVISFAFADWPVLQQHRRDPRQSSADHRQPRVTAAHVTSDPRFTYTPPAPGSYSEPAAYSPAAPTS
jgi:hypothetical protein